MQIQTAVRGGISIVQCACCCWKEIRRYIYSFRGMEGFMAQKGETTTSIHELQGAGSEQGVSRE